MPLQMHRGRLVRAALIGVVSTLPMIGADAQSGGQRLFAIDSGAAWGATWSRPTRCTATMKSSDVTSGTIYLSAGMAPTADSALTSQADLLARDVASELRKQLGGSDNDIPSVGDKIEWFSVPAELILIARPDGSMKWRGLSVSGDAAAVELLSTAMASSRRHGNALMLWPDGYAADSIVIRLSLLPASFFDALPVSTTTLTRMRFSAFTIPYPSLSPALPKSQLEVNLPFFDGYRAKGRTLTKFVVDTSGRAIMSTFKDIYPEGSVPLSDEFKDHYTEIIQAVQAAVASATFKPAHVGPCPVEQVVQLPIEFSDMRVHRPKSR